MPTIWEEFGIAVKQARAKANLTGKELAFRAFGDAGRKGYVSQIERGGTRLSARTIARLANALDLPDDVTAPLYRAHLPPEDKLDTDASRLMQMAARDTTAPTTAEALMIALAYDFAQGDHRDLSTAYTGLRNALQTAADMRAELDRMHNLDDRLAAVLRRVADLNDRGLRDEAGEALDAAIKAKEAELEGLQEAALKQDRLRNDPAAAAKRLIARLRAAAPPGGLFNATQRILTETRERGEQQGDPFDLALALELARANHDRAKGPQLATALNDLGNCHLAIGERQSGGGHLTRARNAYVEVLKKSPRQRDPIGWAIYQNNLGNALARLGERTADPDLLRQAIAAYRATLTVYTPQDTPMDWAVSQNNLGVALQALGERTADPDLLRQAIAAYRATLTVRTPEATPMDWAVSQHNLAIGYLDLNALQPRTELLEEAEAAFVNALKFRLRADAEYFWADSYGGLGRVSLARFRLSGDRGQLDLARGYLSEARSVYALDPNNVTLADFDRLLAEIDAA